MCVHDSLFLSLLCLLIPRLLVWLLEGLSAEAGLDVPEPEPSLFLLLPAGCGDCHHRVLEHSAGEGGGGGLEECLH